MTTTPADAYAPGPPTPREGSIRLSILGPLRVWRDDTELNTGARQQSVLLAVLLARAGRPVSADELIRLIWGEKAPASALNVLHQYVGALRRLLEPTLRARGGGSYLLRRGNGYVFAAGPGALDVVDFRKLVAAARGQLGDGPSVAALDQLVAALGLWRGPAGDGMNHGTASNAIFASLNGEFLAAVVQATELAVALRQPERVLVPLQMAAVMAPFDESVHASLMIALGAAGRQADALSIFGTMRTRLADELGVNPGHALLVARQRVFAQDSTSTVEPADEVSYVRPSEASAAAAERPSQLVGRLVGRVSELAILRTALDRGENGDGGLVFVEGEPGAGKTRLLEEIAAEAAARGATVVWSHCIEGEATPSMWPWMQIVDTLLNQMAHDAQKDWLGGELGVLVASPTTSAQDLVNPDSTSQFHLSEKMISLLARVAARRPLVLLLDDIQWADTASLRLLTQLTSQIPANTMLFGALRDRASTPGTELARMLGAASRVPGHRRIALGPLELGDVIELVRRETGHPPSPAAARSLLARTDGNPLFVRELSRLLAKDGVITEAVAAQPGVPATVRDLVGNAVSDLSDTVTELLQLAALIGRDADLGVLSRAADLDVHTCLELIEPVEALGLLGASPGDPFSQRFSHDLIREAVAASIPPQRGAALHARIADALQNGDTVDDVVAEQVAYHLWAAGPLADPTRTVGALIRAGRRAAAKTALDTAERQLLLAVEVARAAANQALELTALSELITVVGMSSPHGTAALKLLERAESLATSLGRHEEATILLYSRWMALAYGAQYGHSEPLARRLLDSGNASTIPVVRALGLQGWGLQQAAVGNIGEAFRYLSEAGQSLLIVPAQRENDAVWYAQQLSALGLLAEMTAVHGDVPAARVLLERLETMAGEDPFKITVWAVHSVRIASVVGDPVWALAVTKKGIAADPELSFGFFGMYQRLARHWALAMTGHDPSASAKEVHRLITTHLLDPPRSDIATWYALLAEMHLAANTLDAAAAALDLADQALDTHGQRYSEGLILLVRARLRRAQGQPIDAVRTAAEAARDLSVAREAHLFAARATKFLGEVGDDPENRFNRRLAN